MRRFFRPKNSMSISFPLCRGKVAQFGRRGTLASRRSETGVSRLPNKTAGCKPAPRIKTSLHAGSDLVHQGLFVGELARLELRVEQLAVGRQLEAAAPAGDKLQITNLLFERRQQLGRQTDGLRLVASHRAISQLQIHLGSPFDCEAWSRWYNGD